MAPMSPDRAYATLIAMAISLPLVGGALYLWAERGWLILVDLARVGIHSFCL